MKAEGAERSTLPDLLAGPIVRRVEADKLVLWFVTSLRAEGEVLLYLPDGGQRHFPLDDSSCHRCRVGERAWINLVDLSLASPLPDGQTFDYDLRLDTEYGRRELAELQPELLYPGRTRPSVAFKSRLDRIVHGSCRKPHFDGDDALLRLDEVIESSLEQPQDRPALLLMSGDQVYADDVAGPMLDAIHQVVARLGLYCEALQGAEVADCEQLYASPFCYYQREELLPHDKASETLRDRFFGGARKPIFTADGAHNHLITFAEVIAMYLLVWSPTLWREVTYDETRVPERFRARYRQEQGVLSRFEEGLPRVQRALAHLPVYMIFDDHDITDDWNLTRGWEEAAYSHPFSRRIIGNALIGYWLCQGWGNAPEQFPVELWEAGERYFARPDAAGQDALIDMLLRFERWHYTLPTSPKLVVLDTRTRRWRSESSLAKPSGLMDWEALSDMQQELIGEPAVVMVSPAPIFGVKLIEAVQRVFTYFGHALMVDAENWMAHPGAANTLLNIFRHPKTPGHFVILSGDVHYSFVYDVVIRFRKNSPRIWQITCSGMKNEFPRSLLPWLDRLNCWFYSSRSPLNWLTKRRHMRVRARHPDRARHELFNGSALGLVCLDERGKPTRIELLKAEGGCVGFPDESP